MFGVLEAGFLAPRIKRFVVQASAVAAKARPGQFVIVRLHSRGERIPLTIADSDRISGTITLIVQDVGKTTRLMNTLNAGDSILDLVGPLGRPSEVRRFGTVIVIGGGVGVAIAFPTARALQAAGNEVHFLLGAQDRERLLLVDEIREAVHELVITTDDGSAGERGVVTAPLERWIEAGQPIDRVFAVGPVPMMRAVAEVTRHAGIPTVVSLNSIMVDGTGMCGGCRVLIGNESRFACVDGPEFDAHEVDFEVLEQRNRMYREAERQALARYEADPEHEARRLAECALIRQVPELAEALTDHAGRECGGPPSPSTS